MFCVNGIGKIFKYRCKKNNLFALFFPGCTLYQVFMSSTDKSLFYND